MGDPQGKFTEALDLGFDASAIFGNIRSKRYVLEIEGGKVKEVHVEPDNTGVDGESSYICACTRKTLLTCSSDKGGDGVGLNRDQVRLDHVGCKQRKKKPPWLFQRGLPEMYQKSLHCPVTHQSVFLGSSDKRCIVH